MKPADLPHCNLCYQVLSQIPKRFQHGLNMLPTVPVCMDASESILVVGANLGVLKVYAVNISGEIGLLFIYNRKLGKVSTIKLKEQVATLKVISIDYDYVAVGCISGNLIVYRLPSSLPNLSRKLALYSVRTHTSRITSLEWSSDANLLYSGDSSGLVVVTQLQFDKNTSHSSFVCSYDAEVVQLVYVDGKLLTATLNRAYICPVDIDTQPTAIGTTERKLKDKFGIQLCSDSDGTANVIVAARPGFRLWKANFDGSVLETVILRESVAQGQLSFAPANPQIREQKDSKPLSLASSLTSLNSIEPTSNLNFLQLYKLSDTQLVSFSKSHLFVIDLSAVSVANHYCFPDNIIGVAVCPINSEIFVLCERHYLARIGEWPDDSICGSDAIMKSSESSRSASPIMERLRSAKNSVLSNFSRSSADKTDTESVSSVAVSHPINSNSTGSVVSDSESGQLRDFLAQFELKSDPKPPKSFDEEKVVESNKSIDIVDLNTPVVLNSEVLVIRKSAKSRKTASSLPPSENNSDPNLIEKSDENGNSVVVRQAKSSQKQPQYQPQSDEINLYSQVVESLSNQPAVAKSFTQDISEGISLPSLSEPSHVDKVKKFVEGPDQPVSRQFLEDFLQTSVLGDYQSVLEPIESKIDPLPEVLDLPVDTAELKLSQSEPSQTESFPTAPDECSLPEAHRFDFDNNIPMPIKPDYDAILQMEMSSKRKFNPPVDHLTSTPDNSTGGNSTGGELALPYSPLSGYELDIWSRCETQFAVVSLAACKNYIAYGDCKKILHYSVLDRPQLEWKSLSDERSDLICLSGNGKIVWRLSGGTIWALVRPHRRKPRGQQWVEAGFNVLTMAVSGTSGWYVKANGEIFAQTGLTSERPRAKEVKIACEYNLVQLSCTAEAVWALRDNGGILVRMGLSRENPTGLDWVDFSTDESHPFVHLSLHGEFCFAVDSSCQLWFTGGISLRRPLGTTGRWWQVRLPSTAANRGPIRGFGKFSRGTVVSSYQQIPSLSVSAAGIWLSYGKEILYSRGSLTGHRWMEPISKLILPTPNLVMACGSAFVIPELDFVWLLRQKGEILAFQPQSDKVIPMEADSKHQFVCISAAPNALWALDRRGGTFIRVGLEPILTPLGSGWTQLDTRQLGNVALRHICCSATGVWATDSAGQVRLRLGVEPLLPGGMPPAWVPVEDFTGKSGLNPEFTQVQCSYDGLTVWALSKSGNVYCRLGITPDMPVGLEWVMISGFECQSIAVGTDTVWALSTDCRLFNRQRITIEDPTGDYWKSIPSANLKYITVTPDNVLWAIDINGRLSKHLTKVYRHNSWHIEDPEEDWELI